VIKKNNTKKQVEFLCFTGILRKGVNGNKELT